MDIPFNEPYLGKEEEQAIVQALRKKHLRGDGPSTMRVQQQMEKWLDVVIPENCDSNYHIFHFLADNPNQQKQLIETLKDNGIPATFHYVGAPFFKSRFEPDSLEMTQRYSNCLVRLPLYPGLKADKDYFSRVVDAIEQGI